MLHVLGRFPGTPPPFPVTTIMFIINKTLGLKFNLTPHNVIHICTCTHSVTHPLTHSQTHTHTHTRTHTHTHTHTRTASSVGPLSSLQPLHQHTQPIQSSTPDCSQKQTSPNSLPPKTNPEARDSGIGASLPAGYSEVAHTTLQLSGIIASVAYNMILN